MIKVLLDALDEDTISTEVGGPHDDARMNFSFSSESLSSFAQYIDVIGRYYNHHFSTCVTDGGRLTASEAQQRAREILEKEYRRENGNIVMAYNDAFSKRNGGIRRQIDLMADHLREEGTRRYVQGVFDRYVAPNSWPEKVTIIREFMAEMSHVLGKSVDPSTPERYASDFQLLIQAFAKGIDGPKRMARRF